MRKIIAISLFVAVFFSAVLHHLVISRDRPGGLQHDTPVTVVNAKDTVASALPHEAIAALSPNTSNVENQHDGDNPAPLATVDSRGHVFNKINFADESIDGQWASVTESSIKRQITMLRVADPDSLHVECRSTHCKAVFQLSYNGRLNKQGDAADYTDMLSSGPTDDVNALPLRQTVERSSSNTKISVEYTRVKR